MERLRRFLGYFTSSGLWLPIVISLVLTALIYAIIVLSSEERVPLPTIKLDNPDDIRNEEMAEIAQRRDEIATLVNGIHREIAFCAGGLKLASQIPADQREASAQAKQSALSDCERSKDSLDHIVIPSFASATMKARLDDAMIYCAAALDHYRGKLEDGAMPTAAPGSPNPAEVQDCTDSLYSAGAFAGLNRRDMPFLQTANEDAKAAP